MKSGDLITTRPYKELDKNFILSTFLRGLYYGESWFSEIPKQEFMTNYHQIVDKILSDPKNTINIACLKEDNDVILGYAITRKDQPIIHWLFVKKSWRNIGIANLLLEELKDKKMSVTHLTKLGLSIVKKKNLTFNPFLL